MNMPIERFEPSSHFVLRTAETIDAYVNPTRMAILGILADSEATLSMIASRLRTTPANLSHHIRKLLESRLIVLIETRATSKNVEKYYRASAYSFSIEMEGESPRGEEAIALSRFRDELAAAASRRMRKDATGLEEAAFARLSFSRIRASDAAAFRSRLEQLAKEFSESGVAEGEGYALGLALFRSGPEAVPARGESGDRPK
jgi:DNA-binding transcriptional ArsR family regulator